VGNGLKHDILKTFTKSILAITGQVNMYLSHIDQVYATYLSGVSSVGTLSVILVQGVVIISECSWVYLFGYFVTFLVVAFADFLVSPLWVERARFCLVLARLAHRVDDLVDGALFRSN